MTDEERRELEAMIDRRGLSEILYALSDICSEKADHILSSYNDRSLSARWAASATRIQLAGDASQL